MTDRPLVAVIMGSRSDWPTMQEAVEILDKFEVPYMTQVISAHRTPDRLATFARTAKEMGLKAIIAGAGGAAHLPGMTAAMTELPVIGVPVKSSILNGVDSLLSIVQMPYGIPVATMAIGQAKNAALFAVSILALSNENFAHRYATWRQAQTENVPTTVADTPKE